MMRSHHLVVHYQQPVISAIRHLHHLRSSYVSTFSLRMAAALVAARCHTATQRMHAKWGCFILQSTSGGVWCVPLLCRMVRRDTGLLRRKAAVVGLDHPERPPVRIRLTVPHGERIGMCTPFSTAFDVVFAFICIWHTTAPDDVL